MSKVILRKNNRERRKIRVKKRITGTLERPRVSVFRSNKYEYVQIIDDTAGKTLLSLSLNDIKKLHESKKKSDASFEIGKQIADKAKKLKIKSVVFDRNGYKYHGRIKNLADGMREGGLVL